MKKIFLNDRVILVFILLNIIVINLHSFRRFSIYYNIYNYIDIFFTLFFCVEIWYKIYLTDKQINKSKFSAFLSNRWNRLDFISVLIALPSIGVIFSNDLELFAGFTILRVLRLFKLVRIIEYIPNGKIIGIQVVRALKSVTFIIFGFLIYTTIISLIATSIFKNVAPYYFRNAFESFFTIFKLFVGDSMSDIIEMIQRNSDPFFTAFSKFFLMAIVFSGNVLGISLINFIFYFSIQKQIGKIKLFTHQSEQNEEHEIEQMKKDLQELKKSQMDILNAINHINK